MEWANGDVRMNYSREVSFSRIKDPEDPCPIYTRDYPAKSYVDYPESHSSPPQPQSTTRVPSECASSHCGYSPGPAPHRAAPPPFGISHPDYRMAATTKVDIYPPESYSQTTYVPVPEYSPTEQCHFQPPRPPYDDPERGGFPSTSVCTECPGGGAPCDYGPPATCYSGEDCQVSRGDLRTTADGRAPSGGRDVPIMEAYPMVHKEPSLSDIHQDCYDSRSLQSHHASHCDLREFQEWRHTRGSRESLSHLPPELEKHLRDCRCPCDHLGYGNFQVE